MKKIGWSPESAVGRPFNLDSFDGTVVGVVRDFNFKSLHHEIEPLVMIHDPKNERGRHSLGVVSVRIRPENAAATLDRLKRRLDAFFRFEPIQLFIPGRGFSPASMHRRMMGRQDYRRFFADRGHFHRLPGPAGVDLIRRRAAAPGNSASARCWGPPTRCHFFFFRREFLVLLGIIDPARLAGGLVGRRTAGCRISPTGSIWTGTRSFRPAHRPGPGRDQVSFQALRAATADPVKALRYE